MLKLKQPDMYSGMRGNLITVVCKGCCGVFVLNNICKSPAVDNFVMNMGEFICHCSSLVLTKGIEPTVQ